MKLFTLRTTSEEQKANQAFQLRLIQVLAIVTLTAGAVMIGLAEIFGKIPEQNESNLIYLPCIIVLLNVAPSAMKYSWKVLLPRIILQTVAMEIFLFLVNKIS